MRQLHAVDAVIILRSKDFPCCESQSVKLIVGSELELGTALYYHASDERVNVHAENVGMLEQSALQSLKICRFPLPIRNFDADARGCSVHHKSEVFCVHGCNP